RVRKVIDRRTVRQTDVVALPILRRGIVNLEEKLEQLAIGQLVGIEHDFDCFRVRAVVAVRRVRHVAAGIADPCPYYARQLADQILHAPKAPACEDRRFGSRHGRWSPSRASPADASIVPRDRAARSVAMPRLLTSPGRHTSVSPQKNVYYVATYMLLLMLN